MPVNPGGTPTGGSPGGATPGESASAFTALTEAQEKAMKSLFGLEKATEDYDKTASGLRKTIQGMIEDKKKEIDGATKGTDAYTKLGKELSALEKAYQKVDKEAKDAEKTQGTLRKTLKGLIDDKKKVIEATKKETEEYAKLKKELSDLEKVYDKVTDSMDKGATVSERAADATGKIARTFKDIAGPISEGMKSYHSYNLEIQKQIELSGKWTGSQSKAHKVFGDVREQLNLTRKEGLEFISTWSEGQKLGLANDQLVKMTKNLRDVYGTAEGLKMMGEFIKIPASAGALKDLAGGKDTAATLRALKTATPAQAQAIVGAQRTREGRPEVAQRGARFQEREAKVEKFRDDMKLGMEMALDAGLGPEVAAMLGPLTGIAEDVHHLAEIVDAGFKLKGLATGIGVAGEAAGAAGGAGNLLSKIPGVGGALAKISAGGVNLSVGNVLKGGMFGAAGETGGAVADWGAQKLEEGGHTTGAKFARVGGMAARGAGYGAMAGSILPGLGTGVGAGVGAAGGALYGIGEEWGADILKAMKDGSGYVFDAMTGAGTGGEKKPQQSDVLQDFATNMQTLNAQIKQIGSEIAEVPENITSEIELSRLPTALAAIDPKRMFDIGEKAASSFGVTMDLANKRYSEQITIVRDQMKKLDDQLKNGIINQKDHNDMSKQYTATLNKLTNETARATLENAPSRKAAAGAMQRLETRGGQIGTEQATARSTFQMTGAITGNLEEINKFQTDINKGYDDLLTETENASKIQEKNLTTEKSWYEAQLANRDLDKALVPVYQEQLQAVNNQLEQNTRTLNAKRATTKLEKQSLAIEADKARDTAYELTLASREAKAAQEIVGIREAAARARGITPEEAGGFAQKRLDTSKTQLAEIDKDFTKTIEGWRAEIRKPDTTEGKRMELEQRILDHTIKREGLEGKVTENTMKAATAQEEERQKQLGLQKRILEINRNSASLVGASWQEMMKFQTKLIEVSKEELASAQKELELAVIAGAKSDVILQKQINVDEKRASVIEATTGKQRDFLEKAIAAGFGMGGGTKALPNINKARIFGEQFINQGGLRVQGAGATIAQQAANRMAGEIPGMGKAAGLPGVGLAAGLPGAGIIPGLLGPVAKLPGKKEKGPGAEGAKEVKEAKAGAAQPVDVSGKIDITFKVEQDEKRFQVQVSNIAKSVFLIQTSKGADT